ncbi:L-serine ammonia-lyase, iron-sulfur-dependent, subunit alpha [uncultured Amphritea sp.]|mgnify:CR=1 FL=1|uniref:L-serine ammonia-lyase, iron-sulfur-dependent, subunit alpha n=1 Tax=Amphritea sp. TaxID=1872502 RepID=UPI0025EFBA1F|nr:L-serine ammonia-lyase, iron-sulfur-dependent, subunit alpha [uncultured Amphritea sp.]
MAISSIFNDVIGPVMRGPSSSHSAAACRIGLLLRDLIGAEITDLIVDYDPNGSLVSTHESQGTDMGLYGGILGWQADDERMMNYRQGIADSGISVQVNYLNYNAQHPNTYRIRVANAEIQHSLQAISTGGGMIEVQEIDGAAVEVCGDFHELLIYGSDWPAIEQSLPASLKYDFMVRHRGQRCFVELKSAVGFDAVDIATIEACEAVNFVRYLKPVLPVLSRKDIEVPFRYCQELLAMGQAEGLELWQLAARFESARGDIAEAGVFQRMRDIVRIMDQSIQAGLRGTEYDDRILPSQSLGFRACMETGTLLKGDLLNTIVMYVSAMMEVKSSLGVIVAAPTAGSCGALPGSLLGAAKSMGRSEDDVVKAMLASGVIGVFISEHSSFAAEVGGCQAECGAGSAMAAAGLVTLAGGSLQQAVTAASLALQNSLGMICDPIANRVEAPCLGRNVMAASNAVSCANMALADYDPVVTFDEVVATHFNVGKSIAHELRCTALGGLSVTDSSKRVEAQLLKFKSC